MEPFWKAIAVILLTVILSVTLGKTEKDIALVLSIAACCIILVIAFQYLTEVISFLWEWGSSIQWLNSCIGSLLKITGVALTMELTGLISADAGNSALGKAMQILGNAVILYLSLPLFEHFLSIVQEIMGFL